MPRFSRLWLALSLIVVAGCSAAPVQTGSPSPLPSAPPSVSPAGGVTVTFRVADREEFKALVTDPANIAIVRDLLAGKEGPAIPNGRIVNQTGVNTGYHWSMDPTDIEFADMTTEVCDGLPSDVENHAITSDRYCPWAAKVVAVDPAP